MTRSSVYKLIFILFVIIFSIILILPTVGKRTMNIIMNPDATAEHVDAIKKRFPAKDFLLTEKGKTITVEGYGLSDAVMNEVRIFQGVQDAKVLPHWAEKAVLSKKINLGLDLQGGMQLVLRANFDQYEKKMGHKLTEKDKADLTGQALELLRNRVDKFGVSEPSIRPRGNEAVEIQLPGVKDPQTVKKLIGTTGAVEYRLVSDEYNKRAAEWVKKNFKEPRFPESTEDQYRLLTAIAKDIQLPDNQEIFFYFERDQKSKKIFPGYPIVLDKKISLAGTDINKAWVGQDEYGRLAVHFTTTPEGAVKFATVTGEKNHGKKLAIVIDNKVRSAPQINVTINTGTALIQGDFTIDEVNSLTSIIKEGALPVDLTIMEERSVGPSLGQNSIDSGVKAMVAALIIVMGFMIVYYKLSGVIASLGLILNFIFMVALLSWLNFTVTLPGIAGFILTVGMAVDANVIIYERMKEELRAGKSVKLSVTAGFDRAFWTIFDSNLTTLIAAFVLAQFGTGPIRGFAVTLSIGILTSMFVALYITKFVFENISSIKRIKKLSI